MKKLFSILLAVLLTATVWAQSPQKMSYQAVIRNSSNALITSTIVGMQISILKDSSNGTPVYIETQTPRSNANGLVTIEIGGGPGFDTINWTNGPYFIKTETDPTGGTTYTISGSSQLLSVPYALYAETTGDTSMWKKNNSSIYYNSGNVGIGTTNPKSSLQIGDRLFFHDVGETKAIFYNFFWNGTNYEYATTNPVSGIEFNNTSTGSVSIFTGGQGTAGSSAGGNISPKLYIGNNGNVGIGGLVNVNAKLSLTSTGIELLGTAASTTFRTMANDLGATAGSELPIASFGFNSAPGSVNNSSLGIRAYRTTNGPNWQSTAICLSMDVDNTIRAGASIWLNVNGNVGIGSATHSKLTVSGGDINVLDIGSGVIMKSPNGNCWRVTIDNSGNLLRTAITCP